MSVSKVQYNDRMCERLEQFQDSIDTFDQLLVPFSLNSLFTIFRHRSKEVFRIHGFNITIKDVHDAYRPLLALILSFPRTKEYIGIIEQAKLLLDEFEM